MTVSPPPRCAQASNIVPPRIKKTSTPNVGGLTAVEKKKFLRFRACSWGPGLAAVRSRRARALHPVGPRLPVRVAASRRQRAAAAVPGARQQGARRAQVRPVAPSTTNQLVTLSRKGNLCCRNLGLTCSEHEGFTEYLKPKFVMTCLMFGVRSGMPHGRNLGEFLSSDSNARDLLFSFRRAATRPAAAESDIRSTLRHIRSAGYLLSVEL